LNSLIALAIADEEDHSNEDVFVELASDLSRDETIRSIERDPYWPKWDTPWWKCVLLMESGKIDLIPPRVLLAFADALSNHYIHTFPLSLEEIPPGKDPVRQILCFCAAGTLLKLFSRSGLKSLSRQEVRDRFGWLLEWASQYQLEDGGFNCDEAAYTSSRKSSMVSTVAFLEGLLEILDPSIPSERAVLEKGAAYLVSHRLLFNSRGAIIDSSWTLPLFPRFYEYDVLRGARLLIALSERLDRKLDAAISEALALYGDSISDDGIVRNGQEPFFIEKSYTPSASPSESLSVSPTAEVWTWTRASSFPALDRLHRKGQVSAPLTREWYEMLSKIDASGK
jgi:hypothetical protein